MNSETAAVRPDEEMDWAAVARYLAPRVPYAEGPMVVRQFPGGSANLTYLIRFGAHEYVLRRPPLGPVAPGAHDMAREHNVLSRLYNVFDKAPKSFHLCTDESVIGAKFIVVERRNGVVIRDRYPDAMRGHDRLAQRTSYAHRRCDGPIAQRRTCRLWSGRPRAA
jgi:aminoglycoside phosphotransferase (APT) family kinase protein